MEVKIVENFVGLRLRNIMQLKMISSKELAESSGVCCNSILNYIHGKASPNVLTFEMLCTALDITPSDFYRPYPYPC